MIINDSIINLSEWGNFISNSFAIYKIAEEIVNKVHLKVKKISRINIGTNAIFDLGNHILKVYATSETSDPFMDCRREIILSNALRTSPYCVPEIIHTGYINDRYTIYFIIMKKIDGLYSFSNAISNESPWYATYLQELHRIIAYLHSLNLGKTTSTFFSKSIKNYDTEESEYADFLRKYITRNPFTFGIVHGDLSESNIYINKNGIITLLDFEDWMYAPIFVEYPSICFELLKSPKIIKDFFNDIPINNAIEMLIASVLLHHESERFLKIILLQMGNTKALPSICDLKLFFYRWLA